MSNYAPEELLGKFGIEEIDPTTFWNPIILAPPHLANMTYLDLLDNYIEWTPQLRYELQMNMLTLTHENSCLSEDGTAIVYNTNYPRFLEKYEPPSECLV
jgi:hypothetical protein